MSEKEIAYREGYAKGYADAKKNEKHGRWILKEDGYHCSNCDIQAIYTGVKLNYCPNCGAIMDLPNITEQTENALRKLGEHREEVDFDYNAED